MQRRTFAILFAARRDVDPRMRVAVLELHHIAFDRDALLLDIRRSKRMVAESRDGTDENDERQAK